MAARYGLGEGFATGATFPFPSRPLFPVRVERSRGTHRDGAIPRGISTSLNANGYGVFMRIGIVAPSTPILPDDAEAARAVVSLGYPGVELEFDPQCFAIAGHLDRKSTRLNSSPYCA